MTFLGSLGIDVKLLVAQMINFGLLVFVLSKFVYKPVVRRIEEDEEELAGARKDREALESEKQKFSNQKKQDEESIRKRNQALVDELETITESIKDRGREQSEKEVAAIVAQAKEGLRAREPMIREEVMKDLRAKIGGNVAVTFAASLSDRYRHELQVVFFKALMDELGRMDFPKMREAELVEGLEKTNTQEKKSYEKQVGELLEQKIGAIGLQYALPFTKEQREELDKKLSEKIGFDIQINGQQNKNLIVGFRLEIMGFVIEKNLLDIAQNAVHN